MDQESSIYAIGPIFSKDWLNDPIAEIETETYKIDQKVWNLGRRDLMQILNPQTWSNTNKVRKF